jgi:putative hydrolase of the HAD superfamily
VSSAWVGARKPHPRIYTHTLERLGIGAADAIFVGDTWNCDVAGPLAAGLRPVYLRRAHFGSDLTAPDHHADDVVRAADLTVLLELVGN